ncbi:MAG: leucyl/phenylalanyl-tRNA--protein transferase [Candidatus Dormibacteria bacterium]
MASFRRPGRGWPEEVLALGGDLEPHTLLDAYARGLFPMPVAGRLAWWSPDPRGVLPVEAMHVSRSLRRAARRFEIRVDTAFDAVMAGCADPRRAHGWIDGHFRWAYGRLHRLGHAHSVEVWSLDDGELAGGLYGVSIGGLFAAESKFHRLRDASKVAVLALVELLRAQPDAGSRLLDVQWRTDHLATLGVVDIRRAEYLTRLQGALTLPPPAWTDLDGTAHPAPTMTAGGR